MIKNLSIILLIFNMKSMKKLSGVNIHKGNSTTGGAHYNVSDGTSVWSSGAWLASGTDPYADSDDYKNELEMNWSKVKQSMGEEEYNKILRDAIKKWMQYEGSERIESLLQHEGFLDTRRENSLNNLLDDELGED